MELLRFTTKTFKHRDEGIIMTPFATNLQSILSQRLNVSEDDIKAVCQRWKIEEMALFGSVLREDVDKDSDVDVLVFF